MISSFDNRQSRQGEFSKFMYDFAVKRKLIICLASSNGPSITHCNIGEIFKSTFSFIGMGGGRVRMLMWQKIDLE